MEKTEKIVDLTALVVIAGLILLWNLGTGSLLSWDEAVYAQVSKEMLNSHNYMDLTLAGQQWSDKPPLYMWMTVIFYRVFGIGEFAVRLFSALCGIGTVIVTYLLALALYSRRTAVAAALVLLSTQHFIWASKVGMLDAALTFFITLSLYWFITGEDKKQYLFFSMIAFACAFLTKGFGAMLIPMILAVYIVWTKKFNLIKEPALLCGLFAAFIILALWHLTAFIHYGKEFISGYFTKHLLARVSGPLEGHEGTLWTYLKVIPNKGRPWGILTFFVIPAVLWQAIIKKENTKFALPVIWALTAITVFSLVKTKLHWYIMPVYPAISVLIGWGVSKLLDKKSIAAVVLCFIASLLYLTFERHIFNLDYSHETKKLALFAREKISGKDRIYVYGSDPAVRFYFLNDKVDPERSLTMDELLSKRDRYVVLDKKTLNMIKNSGILIVGESTDFAVIKVN